MAHVSPGVICFPFVRSDFFRGACLKIAQPNIYFQHKIYHIPRALELGPVESVLHSSSSITRLNDPDQRPSTARERVTLFNCLFNWVGSRCRQKSCRAQRYDCHTNYKPSLALLIFIFCHEYFRCIPLTRANICRPMLTTREKSPPSGRNTFASIWIYFGHSSGGTSFCAFKNCVFPMLFFMPPLESGE